MDSHQESESVANKKRIEHIIKVLTCYNKSDEIESVEELREQLEITSECGIYDMISFIKSLQSSAKDQTDIDNLYKDYQALKLKAFGIRDKGLLANQEMLNDILDLLNCVIFYQKKKTTSGRAVFAAIKEKSSNIMFLYLWRGDSKFFEALASVIDRKKRNIEAVSDEAFEVLFKILGKSGADLSEAIKELAPSTPKTESLSAKKHPKYDFVIKTINRFIAFSRRE